MDIQKAIDTELPAAGVPFTLTPDLAVVLGRRARRRRRLALGASGVLPVAAGAVALALPLGTIGGGSTVDPTPSATAPPVATLGPPQLVVPSQYDVGFWDGPGAEPAESDETRSYTAAFWSYFTERFPGVLLRGLGPDGPGPDPTGPIEEHGLFVRGSHTLEPAGSEPVERFRYRLDQVQDGETSNLMAVLFPGRDGLVDYVGVEVYPAASHHQDAADAFDLAAYHYLYDGLAHQVQRATGPQGEDLRFVTLEDETSEVGRYVVLYRPDGSAVVVSDATPQFSEEGPLPPEDRYAAYLSFEELTGIAAALPLLPVR